MLDAVVRIIRWRTSSPSERCTYTFTSCKKGKKNMALLKRMSNHHYAACRPSDGQFLGYFHLHSREGVYLFEAGKSTFLYEDDLRSLSNSFWELTRDLQTEHQCVGQMSDKAQTAYEQLNAVQSEIDPVDFYKIIEIFHKRITN